MTKIATIRAMLLRDLAVNARLRIGVGLIVFISLFYVVLVLSDSRAAIDKSYRNLITEYEDLIALEAEDIWRKRLANEQLLHQTLFKKVWQGDTEGLVNAELQRALRSLAAAAGIVNPSVQIGTPLEVEGRPYRIMRAQVTASYSEQAAVQLLYALESHSPLLAVERLDVKVGRQNGRLEVLLLAYTHVGQGDKIQ